MMGVIDPRYQCSTCRHGQMNVLWIRYPDRVLRAHHVIVCLRELPQQPPPLPPAKRWLGFRNMEIRLVNPENYCDSWEGGDKR